MAPSWWTRQSSFRHHFGHFFSSSSISIFPQGDDWPPPPVRPIDRSNFLVLLKKECVRNMQVHQSVSQSRIGAWASPVDYQMQTPHESRESGEFFSLDAQVFQGCVVQPRNFSSLSLSLSIAVSNRWTRSPFFLLFSKALAYSILGWFFFFFLFLDVLLDFSSL